ncbi:MAG: hypothetical protein QXR09_04130 [Candidatus Aenigmatarchaeota archaeon]
MKGQTIELIEMLMIIVGISILLILFYFSYYRTSLPQEEILTEEIQYERITNFVVNFFYSRIPGIDKTVSQIFSDRLLSDSDIVYYGERYGAVNFSQIIYDYFDSYFDKRWNLSIHVLGEVRNSVLWIPNSGNGNSISKVNTENGKEIGRYYTVPSNVNGDPSRVAVDSKGNVWVGNRGTRTIVKIGLLENNQCIDKDGDGKIETSKDFDENGVVESYEMYNFGKDECLLAEVFIGGTQYGNFGKEGVRAVCVDENDNVYAGIYAEKKLFYISKDGVVLNEWDLPISPYGCFVDEKGIVWISGIKSKKLLKFDPKTGNMKTINIGHIVYGIAPCYKEDCLVINGWEDSKLTKLNTTTDQIIFSLDKPELYQGRGITVDEDNNIYAVSSGKNLIVKYDKNGNELTRASTCNTPTGVGIDYFRKIWVTCIGDNGIARYTRDLTPEIKNSFGTAHYVYNFFTSFNLKPTIIEKKLSFGYPVRDEERVRTFIIKLPLPQPSIGGIVNVVLKQW